MDHQPAVLEALLDLAHAVNLIDTSSAEDLAAFDALSDLAQEYEIGFTAAAQVADEEPSTAVLAIGTLLHLYKWFEGGAAAIDDLREYVVHHPTDGTPGDAILRMVLESAAALAALQDDEPNTDRTRVSAALLDLAEVVQRHGADEVAYKCCLAGTNFLQPREPGFTEAVELLMKLVDLDDPDRRAITFARHAQDAAVRAVVDRSLRIAAFDAAEAALTAMPGATDNVAACRGILDLLLHDDDNAYMRFLAPVFAAVGEEEGEEPSDEIAAVRATLDQVSDETDFVAWVEWLQEIGPAAMALENARLGLVAPPEKRTAEMSWDTFAFDHPAFARSVPSDMSIRRDRYADELLLVLAHETAHVVSMQGDLGLALLALRVAAFDRELKLWTFDAGVQDGALPARRPAPLSAPDVVALAEAEQALELVAKRRLLQRELTPWCEGLAMFVELDADPTGDDEAFTAVTELIMNLEDRSTHNEAEERGTSIGDAVTALGGEAQARYAAALERLGRTRLRIYFDEDPDRYLPGYLLVRAVVASWRQSCGRRGGLSGERAARLLLHLTQFGAAPIVPDLSLPLDEFQEDLCRRFAAWSGS